MKKLLSSILLSVIAIVVYSQAPASFRYQALIQDAAGNIKVATQVTVLFDILQGGASGAVVYSETHSVTTTSTGLVNVDLGLGSATLGTFAAIDWSTGIYYLRITVNGTVMGTTQLLSVPYALYSSEAGNVFSGNYEDLTNQPDLTTSLMTLSWLELVPWYLPYELGLSTNAISSGSGMDCTSQKSILLRY